MTLLVYLQIMAFSDFLLHLLKKKKVPKSMSRIAMYIPPCKSTVSLFIGIWFGHCGLINASYDSHGFGKLMAVCSPITVTV